MIGGRQIIVGKLSNKPLPIGSAVNRLEFRRLIVHSHHGVPFPCGEVVRRIQRSRRWRSGKPAVANIDGVNEG